MPNPKAVLVEDEPESALASKEVLEAARFDVEVFGAIAPALDHLSSSSDLYDLFVLDRRLPIRPGEPAADELGDGLLAEVRSRFPDARVIVFTGYAAVAYLQQALAGSGQLPSIPGQPIDRVTVLEKGQSLEFKEQVENFRQVLQALDDIELALSASDVVLGYLEKRALRRLAFEYGAGSIKVTALRGGLTGASVWKCSLRSAHGHVGNVVVKRVKQPVGLGGLSQLLPLGTTTSPVATVSGLMGGQHLNVLQAAGENPCSLMDVLEADPSRAVELVRPMWAELQRVEAQPQMLSLAAVCKSLIAWEDLEHLLGPHRIVVPAGTLTATVEIGCRHGDLHPANVLIDGDRVVLIDLDSITFAAAAIDPVTMLISTLVHPESPLRGANWPDEDEIRINFGSPEFGQGTRYEVWFRAVSAWAQECQTSEREFWALALAYAARQLNYDDVTGDAQTVSRVVAVAARSAAALRES